MHEALLMNDLIRKIEAVAREQNARRVVGIKVRLGALAHMSAHRFREHFAVASQGMLAQGAKLNLDVHADATALQAQEILLESVEIAE